MTEDKSLSAAQILSDVRRTLNVEDESGRRCNPCLWRSGKIVL